MYRILNMLTEAGFTKVTLELTSLHDDESAKAIRSSVKAIVRETMKKVSQGRALEEAIEDVDTGYDSPAMRLQKYAVAASHDPEDINKGPEEYRDIDEEVYKELINSGDASITVIPFYQIGSYIHGIIIDYELYLSSKLSTEKTKYYGRCYIEAHRFVMISRRQERKNR